MGTTQDITDAVAADEERTRLVSAVEQTADSIWMQDLNNMVTYVNPAFTRAYGYPAEAIVGRHAGLVDSGRHPASFFTEVWATAAAGRTWQGSIINRRMDGTEFEVAAVISGIRDASGRIISYMQTDRDVTRERALESALEREARERGIDRGGARPDRLDGDARGDRRHRLLRDRGPLERRLRVRRHPRTRCRLDPRRRRPQCRSRRHGLRDQQATPGAPPRERRPRTVGRCLAPEHR